MFYEGYVCRYVADEEGFILRADEPEYYDEFPDYRTATEWFTRVMKENHDDLARWFVKVYTNREDKGEILCACSMMWGDEIFNERAV